MQTNTTKLRTIYAAGFLLLVGIEVLIALFVHDRFLRPYGGDIIVMAVLYCLVRILFPTGIKALPLYLFLFAVCVEIGQAMDYVTLLGLQDIRFFRILLGTSFSWYDIACYGAGSLICALIQIVTIRKASAH